MTLVGLRFRGRQAVVGAGEFTPASSGAIHFLIA